MESAPKTARPQKRPATAPLNVCVYKVTGRAGDVWSSFEGSVAALWQIQVDHNAHQSVLFNLRDALSDFLRQASADKEGYPNGLDGLLSQGGVKLVLADKNDPEGAGFIQWRAAFYVAGVEGAVKNFFMLLDDFFVWKMKALQKEVEACPPTTPHCRCALVRCDMPGAHLPARRPGNRWGNRGRIFIRALHAARRRGRAPVEVVRVLARRGQEDRDDAHPARVRDVRLSPLVWEHLEFSQRVRSLVAFAPVNTSSSIVVVAPVSPGWTRLA